NWKRGKKQWAKPEAQQVQLFRNEAYARTTNGWRPPQTADRPQSDFSARPIGAPLPPSHQSSTERNAAAGRQAHHSVWRGRSAGGRMQPDHHHYRTRQERDRRSLRRQLFAGEDARRERQARLA